MTGKKEILADILFNSNLVNLFKKLPMRNKLIILNYHRIKPQDFRFATAFDEGVYNINQDEFARQIKWLKHNTRILSEKDLLDLFQDGGFVAPPTPMPCVVITLDDGYSDNYVYAYEVLKYYEVPAILFVATQMVHNRMIPWWDTIAYLIKQSSKPVITYADRDFPLGNQKKQAIEFFQLLMKQEKYEVSKYLLSELSEICEVALPDSELQDREILTWEEIREMAENKVAIGSHTHTHRVLSTLTSAAQKEEMILSKLIIEENIGRPVVSISYPVGEPIYITAETPQIAAAAGYSLGFTTNTGFNDWKSIKPYEIRRTARLLEKVSTVSLMTVLPELFSWDSAAARELKQMETHPTYADSYYRLGIINLGQGKIEEAIDSFQKAVGFNPDYTEARVKLGISLAFAGRWGEAEQNLIYIITKRPSFSDVYYYLGIIQAGNGQIVKAIENLEKATSINPNYKDALIKLGVLYCRQEQYRLALKMFERASLLDPLDQDLLALTEAGREIIFTYGEASADFTPLISSYIGNSDQIDKLVQGFVTHLSISPNLTDIMAIVEKGDFHRENLEALLMLFRDYKAMFPKYSDVHYMEGILYKKLGHYQEAEECFTEALRLNQNYIKARLGLFNLLKERGRFAESLAHGEVLNKFNLLYPDLYCGLAEVYLGLGKYLEAEKYAEKAVKLSPVYQRVLQVYQKIREHKLQA